MFGRLPLVFLLLSAVAATAAAEELSYYLADAGDPAAYDPDVPRPSAVLGYEVGDWHVRPDQLNAYMQAVAASSPRVTVSVKGHTQEQRPQLLLAITSPRNHARLEEIREQRRGLVDPRQPAPELEELPVVIWLGYSIHGN